LAYILHFAKKCLVMLLPLQLGGGSSQALISAKGEGFSLYPFFTYQTGIAFENPNPFFPATQQIQ
jgi:hypothetical protein